MKRLSLYSTVTFLAFLLGIASVQVYGKLVKLVSAEEEVLVPDPSVGEITHLMPNPMGRMNDGLRVVFLRTEEGKYGFYGLFRVTNESHEAIGFLGYNKNDILSKKIMQSGKVVVVDRDCASGVDGQVLLPEESATFSIKVPNKTAAFEAGFSFIAPSKTSKEAVWKTAWSETIYPLSE